MSQKKEIQSQSIQDGFRNTIKEHPLPKGWKYASLGEICKFEYGSGLPEHKRIIGSISVFGSNGVIGYHNIAITQGPTIIIGRKGSIGQVNYSSNPCWPIDTTYYIDSSKTNCNLIWLFWMLKTLQLNQLNKATGVPGLNREDAYKQRLLLPPLSEQEQIGLKIQRLLQEIERARTACEKQLDTVKALPSAYLREVFESEESKKWERKRLNEICDVFSGSSAPQEKRYFIDGKYPFVRVKDLGKYGRTTNLVDIKDRINDIAMKELSLVKAEKGAILFPKSGAAITTNNRAILGVDAFIVSHLAALKVREGVINNYFIYYWLCFIDMVQYMENPGYPSLKLSTISKIHIPLPPLHEQKYIATKLKEKIEQVEKLHKKIEGQLDSINVLPQTILKKAFKGEL